MAKARQEKDMEVDGVSSTVPGPLYSWMDYALSGPKFFDCHFIYENIGSKYQWKITEVEYQLIRHFCFQEERQLEHRSTYINTDSIIVYSTVLNGEVRCIVNDIEKKLSKLYYAEMNQAVTDELSYFFDLKRLNTTDCLVCDPIFLPGRGFLIFSSSYECLCQAYKAVCSEFERKKMRDTGTNFNVTRKSYDQHTAGSSIYRSNQSSTLSSSTSSSVTNNQENNGDGVQIGSVKVKVHIGSILDAKVEAIVNATNKSMKFDVGVSRVIRIAAGYRYEEKCKVLLQQNGSILQTSQCYSSDPGYLGDRFKWILHAVGPHWDDCERKEECIYLLANTVTNVMISADYLSIASVAMPAISSGHSKVPIELCALAYIIGIQQFGTGRTLQEVHFVDTDITVVNEVKTACNKYKENPISLETMKSMYPKYFGMKLGEDTKNRKSTSNGNPQVVTTQPAASNTSLEFKERNIQVKVYVESILNVKADALVNAANEALSHGAGVAYVICNAAGREFDDECQRILGLKGSLKTTQVLATRPGNLKNRFKYILNAVGPIWNRYSDKTQCLSDLHDTILNILNEAENLHVRTLVMPAISCGIFGVPLKLCAEMYLQGIIDFSQQTALYLKEIHIVDIDVSVLREMTDAHHNYKKNPDSISISGAKTRYPALMKALRSSSAFDMDDKKDVTAHHVDTTQQRNSVKTPTSSESRSYVHSEKLPTSKGGCRSSEQSHTEKLSKSKGGSLFKMKDEKFGPQTAKVFSFQNKMVVKIYTGSIVRFKGDALICSNDDNMLGIGPLAKAVAAAGGSKYNASYSKIRDKYLYGLYKWKLGDVETCSGGDLNVRFVVHVVIESMSRTDQESLKSYRTTLRKIFDTINSYNKSTEFAMPLIGAGQLEKAEDLLKCCQTFFQVLAEFFDGHQADCRIGELHLINRNQKVTQTLIDIFNCNCSQQSEMGNFPVKNEQRSRHLSFTSSSNDENTPTKFPVQRQHSWTNFTETTDEQPVELRGLGARAKTSTGRSKSMYLRNPSARTTRFDRKNRDSYTGDSDLLTKAKYSMDNQSMRNGTEGEKTKTPAKEGNLVIISDDDDDDERSHDETCDDDQRSCNETSLHDVPSVESSDDKIATCVICLDDVKDSMKLDCNHEFCKSCLTQSFTKHKKACPVCGKIFGEITGNQPPGVISFEREGRSLPGYQNCGTIIVKYNFISGIQGSEHPNPGQPYEGTERRGFLPDNEEGRKVRRLLKKAFDRRLVFTIGYSRTTGKDNVVTWNDIHHKTKRDTGAQRFGYPDPTYLQRVQEELAAKGVTE